MVEFALNLRIYLASLIARRYVPAGAQSRLINAASPHLN